MVMEGRRSTVDRDVVRPKYQYHTPRTTTPLRREDIAGTTSGRYNSNPHFIDSLHPSTLLTQHLEPHGPLAHRLPWLPTRIHIHTRSATPNRF